MKPILRWTYFLGAVAASQAAFATAPVQYVGVDLFPLIDWTDEYQASAARGGQVVGVSTTTGDSRAGVWKGPGGAVTDLHPSFHSSSWAFATDGVHQVGQYDTARAALWSGSANSFVDLHPAGFSASAAYGVSGNQQAGYGGAFPGEHALLWNGTAQSVVDLHPSGVSKLTRSLAFATDGAQQGGSVGIQQDGFSESHAALWNGTAASFVDLHPASGFKASHVFGVGNGQQVGSGEKYSFGEEALLWTGTAQSVVNLTPTNLSEFGYITSRALGTNGIHQVGWGQAFLSAEPNHFGGPKAILWSGAANTAVDLNALLPSGLNGSIANTIDDAGVIWGIAGADDFLMHAVKWVPIQVPEPSTIALVASVSLTFSVVRRRAPIAARGR